MSTFAIRQTLASMEVPFDFQKRNSPIIPDWVWPALTTSSEPDPASLERSWERFRYAVQGICKSRRNNHMKTRDAVFESGMSNACDSFNQGTETVKVEFVTIHPTDGKTSQPEQHQERSSGRNGLHNIFRKQQKPPKQSTKYVLRISCLNAIPDEVRNVAFCTADIPSMPPPPVQAERIETTNESVPMVLPEIVEERPIIRNDNNNQQQPQREEDNDETPLMVQVVTVDENGNSLSASDVPNRWLFDSLQLDGYLVTPSDH